MEKEELIQFLKDNLSINVEQYYTDDNLVYISLKLGEEEISRETIHVPD